MREQWLQEPGNDIFKMELLRQSKEDERAMATRTWERYIQDGTVAPK